MKHNTEFQIGDIIQRSTHIRHSHLLFLILDIDNELYIASHMYTNSNYNVPISEFDSMYILVTDIFRDTLDNSINK